MLLMIGKQSFLIYEKKDWVPARNLLMQKPENAWIERLQLT